MSEERETITHTGGNPWEAPGAGTEGGFGSTGNSRRGFWREAGYLAAVDVKRNRASYLVSLVPVVFVGFMAAVLLDLTVQFEGFGTLGEVSESFYNGFFVDVWILGLLPVLMINFFLNADYAARFTEDNMSRRLRFFRGLPIPASTIVWGRALSSLAYFCLSAPAFFVPFMFFARDIPDSLGPGGMAAFVAVCLGYALLAGGFYLYVWLGFSGRQDIWITTSSMLTLLIVAGALNLGLSVSVLETALLASEANEALTVAAGLIAGSVSFTLWMLAATRRLKRREL